jgi:hypothetical protein
VKRRPIDLCPTTDESIGQCVRFDVDSHGSRLQRVEVIGGYSYGIKLETKWDWIGTDRSGASHILLEEIRVHDTGRDAIKITPGCDDVTIRRAEIFNSGVRDGSNAEGIDNVNGDRMLVQDSWLHDIATNGIYFKGGSTDSVVERNRIERVGGAGVLVGFDTSPEFFDLAANPQYYESIRGVVRNNIIANTQGSGIGLYAAKDAQIWNNTLINTAKAYHSPIYFGLAYQDWDPQAGRPPSVNPVIRDNLVYQSSNLPTECVFIRYSNDLGGLSALTGMPAMDYNLYFHAAGGCSLTDRRPSSPLEHGTLGSWQAHIGGESHSLASAPLLAADGHLAAGSPAVDAGSCGGPSDDFDGDPRPQGSSCDIGADEAASLAAHTLTVTKAGSGAGTVSSSPPGISCGAVCFASYAENTSVTLTASPEPASSFAGWSGDCAGTEATVTIVLDRHRCCVAAFQQRIVAELWLPVVAHLAGEGGSAFASDVAVANLGDREAEVGVAYFPDQGAPVEVAQFALLAPGGQAIFQDIVGQLGKDGTKGVLRVRGTQPLLVASRTYNKLAEGNRLGLTPGTSFGQYVPAYRAEEGLRAGERAYVLGLRQGASYRSNLAVANVGSQPARVRIALYLGNGRQVAEYRGDFGTAKAAARKPGFRHQGRSRGGGERLGQGAGGKRRRGSGLRLGAGQRGHLWRETLRPHHHAHAAAGQLARGWGRTSPPRAAGDYGMPSHDRGSVKIPLHLFFAPGDAGGRKGVT